MAEIATYTMIKTKTSYGSTGTECPPKKIIKAISSYISIANESSYGDNEAVKLEDISATAYTFTVANNSKSIGAAGGITSAVDFTSYKIVSGVQSNVSYSLTSTLPSWLTWDSSTRKFTVANNLGSSRIFTATFTQAESGKTVTASVTQAAVSQTYTFTVDGGTSSSGVITKDGGESAAFNFVSTVTTNGTTTNAAYTLGSTLPSWLTWDPVNRRFTATANTGVERTATATFNQTNSGKAVTITIVQGEGDIVYVFTANPTALTVDSPAGNTNSISIVSTKTPPGGSVTNVSYSIASGTLPGWLTWNAGAMNFSVTANTSSSSRTAEVQFVQSGSGKAITITVTQAGTTYVDWRFDIATETVVNDTIGSDGGTLTYYVSSTKDGVDHGFRLTTSSGFMTPTQTGSGSQNITITVSANTSTSSRTDFIEYRQYDSERTIRINITQSGKAADAYVFTVDGSTSTTKTVSASGGNVTVSVVSTKNGATQDWSITNISTDWLTAIKENSNVKLTASSNYTSTSRTGIITLTQAGSSKTATITVNQKVSDEWIYTFEPAEEYKDKPTKITTGKNNLALYTQYTLNSYKQRSLNGIIVDDTQIYVKATYTTDFPSNYKCTTSNIGNQYFITIKTPYTADNPAQSTHYGSFIFTQQDSGNIFKIDIMQVGGRDYRIGTYVLPTFRITDSNVKWYSASHEDLIVYKQGSSDKINGTEVVQSYVSVDIDANKITEDGYVLVNSNGDPASSTLIGNYTCPSSIETTANWFTTNFDQSSSGYGRWYFIFSENSTGTIRNANVQINQQTISDDVTACSVYSNQPETICFLITQHAS